MNFQTQILRLLKNLHKYFLKFKEKKKYYLDEDYRFSIINAKKYDKDLKFNEIKFLIEYNFKKALNYKLNIRNPKTFNEKMQWLKMYYHKPLLTKCSDKYLVKEYITQKIGSKYNVPLIGVWDTFDEIDFEKLPEKFVLKVNWGNGQNIIVTDKTKIDKEDIKNNINQWLNPHSNHYYYGFEWCYKNITPKIIAEEYVEEDKHSFNDYKLYCFNGKVKICYYSANRDNPTEMRVNYYDRNFNILPFKKWHPNTENPVEKSKLFDKMIELAEIIGKDFPFVRVDFYNTGERLYIGELTFYPGNGIDKFDPQIWDLKLGKMLKLPKGIIYTFTTLFKNNKN